MTSETTSNIESKQITIKVDTGTQLLECELSIPNDKWDEALEFCAQEANCRDDEFDDEEESSEPEQECAGYVDDVTGRSVEATPEQTRIAMNLCWSGITVAGWLDSLEFLEPLKAEILKQLAASEDDKEQYERLLHAESTRAALLGYDWDEATQNDEDRSDDQVVCICNIYPEVLLNGILERMETDD